MFKMYLYEVSADKGNTWTEQYMTENEAKEQEEFGYLVKRKDSKLYYKEI